MTSTFAASTESIGKIAQLCGLSAANAGDHS
jgi:hypothetical protein